MSAKDEWKRQRGFSATAFMLTVLAALPALAGTGNAASKPTTVAEIALYQGPDREQILIEGAQGLLGT